jgi:hypothetical protein
VIFIFENGMVVALGGMKVLQKFNWKKTETPYLPPEHNSA